MLKMPQGSSSKGAQFLKSLKNGLKALFLWIVKTSSASRLASGLA